MWIVVAVLVVVLWYFDLCLFGVGFVFMLLIWVLRCLGCLRLWCGLMVVVCLFGVVLRVSLWFYWLCFFGCWFGVVLEFCFVIDLLWVVCYCWWGCVDCLLCLIVLLLVILI